MKEAWYSKKKRKKIGRQDHFIGKFKKQRQQQDLNLCGLPQQISSLPPQPLGHTDKLNKEANILHLNYFIFIKFSLLTKVNYFFQKCFSLQKYIQYNQRELYDRYYLINIHEYLFLSIFLSLSIKKKLPSINTLFLNHIRYDTILPLKEFLIFFIRTANSNPRIMNTLSAMFNQNKIMNQHQRNPIISPQEQRQVEESSGPYFQIIKDYRSSHSPSVTSNPKKKSHISVKEQSDLQFESSESEKPKRQSKSKKIKHRFSCNSRRNRQISTRFRQEKEDQLKSKIQIWSELWNIQLNHFKSNNQTDLLKQITFPLLKTQHKTQKRASRQTYKRQQNTKQSYRQQLLCDSKPIFLPSPSRIGKEERRPRQEDLNSLVGQKKRGQIYVYQHPYYDNENSLYANEDNNSFFFDRVEEL